jgi:hypothetical protein
MQVTVSRRGLGVAPVSPFEDVGDDHPFLPAMIWMKERGITAGCSANPPQFCPDRPATRAEVAAFLYRMENGGGSGLSLDSGVTILGRSVPWAAVGGGLLILAALLRR